LLLFTKEKERQQLVNVFEIPFVIAVVTFCILAKENLNILILFLSF